MTQLALDIRQVACALSVGRSTVYKLINDGAFPTIKIGTRTLVRAKDLEAFVAAQPATQTQGDTDMIA